MGNWLRSYLAEEWRKLRTLSGRARAEYIWQYYKLWIIGAVSLAVLMLSFTIHRLTVPADNWFYVTFANTYAEAGEGSPVWRDFLDYSNFDTKEKNVYFNTNCYFDPSSTAYNAYYTYFVAYVEAGTLDAIVMEREDLALLGTRGWLLDLSLPQAGDLMERYADRLIYALPGDTSYSTEPVPIGIDLSDTPLINTYHIYPETCALGVGANCPHPEALALFLQFLTET